MKTRVLQPSGTKGGLVKSATGGIGRGQITQGPAGYMKNLGPYHKIKRIPFKGFSERSNIKLNLKKITSATLKRISSTDFDKPGLFQDLDEQGCTRMNQNQLQLYQSRKSSKTEKVQNSRDILISKAFDDKLSIEN